VVYVNGEEKHRRYKKQGHLVVGVEKNCAWRRVESVPDRRESASLMTFNWVKEAGTNLHLFAQITGDEGGCMSECNGVAGKG